MMKETNITEAPFLAYYRDNKELNGFNSEEDLEILEASCNIDKRLLLDYIKDRYLTCPLQNFISNCYVSDIQLEITLKVLEEIETKHNADEQEKKILDLFPQVRPQFKNELFPQLLKSMLFRPQLQ